MRVFDFVGEWKFRSGECPDEWNYIVATERGRWIQYVCVVEERGGVRWVGMAYWYRYLGEGEIAVRLRPGGDETRARLHFLEGGFWIENGGERFDCLCLEAEERPVWLDERLQHSMERMDRLESEWSGG